MFNLLKLLESEGHTAIPFSLRYSKNEQTGFSRYFAMPPINPDYVNFDDARLSFNQKIRLFFKLAYNLEAKKKIKETIRKERIDIVHAIQIVNFLYPSIIDGCSEMGIPVIFTVNDYQLLCPSYNFFSQNRICEE